MADQIKKPGLFDRALQGVIKRAFYYASAEYRKATDPQSRALAAQFASSSSDTSNEWTAVEIRQQALTVSWVYAAMRKLAQEFSSAKSEVK